MCYTLWLCFLVMFFFFKQKTAYEMRISDWSSDVCSSDLPAIYRPNIASEWVIATALLRRPRFLGWAPSSYLPFPGGGGTRIAAPLATTPPQSRLQICTSDVV